MLPVSFSKLRVGFRVQRPQGNVSAQWQARTVRPPAVHGILK